MLESFHAKTNRQDVGQAAEILLGDDEIEVEANDRLDVRIHGLSANHAEADFVFAQEREEPVEEIGTIHGDGFPEGATIHAGDWLPILPVVLGLHGSSGYIGRAIRDCQGTRPLGSGSV